MTVEEILERAKTKQDVPWDKQMVQEALALKEELVPILMNHVIRFYEQLQIGGESPSDDAYWLFCNGYHLLATMKETRMYPVLLKYLALPEDQLDSALGGELGGYLPYALANVYDGSLEETEAMAADPQLYVFSRWVLVKAMAILCRRGSIPRQELVRFLRETLKAEPQRINSNYLTGVLEAMAMLHLHELCLDVRNVVACGKFKDREYASYLKDVFTWPDAPGETWEPPELKKDGPTPEERWILSWKAGRNDLCPCGSGRKFKKCCLQKWEDAKRKYPNYREPKGFLPPERQPIIYPPIENVGDHPGLAAYFPREAIAVDEYAFRGLALAVNRPVFDTPTDIELRISTAELWAAFEGFRKLCEENGIQSAEDYDCAFMVHYRSRTWLMPLAQFLRDAGDSRTKAVQEWL